MYSCCEILDLMYIKLILYDFVLKRWTKNARDGIMLDTIGQEMKVDPKLQVTDWYEST